MTESQRKNAESQRNNAESQRTPDREKVLSDLRTIRLYHSLKKHSEAVAAIDDVIALLREMEPVEPIKNPGIAEPYRCGACWSVLGWESEKQRFCPECGRRIKWNG